MIIKLALLFAIPFILFTALDICTTWVGIHHRGGHEINVFTDTSSIRTMLLPEVIFFAIGLIAVLVGAMWKKGDLRTTVDEGFRSFFESFWLPRRLPATVFIYLPVAVAIGRILPVLSNTSLLLAGRSAIVDGILKPLSEKLGWSLFRTNMLLQAIIFGFLVVPLTYVIYCVCKYAVQRDAMDSRA